MVRRSGYISVVDSRQVQEIRYRDSSSGHAFACVRSTGALVGRARACVLLNKDAVCLAGWRWRAGTMAECLETRHRYEDGDVKIERMGFSEEGSR